MKISIEFKDNGSSMEDLKCSVHITDIDFDSIDKIERLPELIREHYDYYMRLVLTDEAYSIFKKNSSK